MINRLSLLSLHADQSGPNNQSLPQKIPPDVSTFWGQSGHFSLSDCPRRCFWFRRAQLLWSDAEATKAPAFFYNTNSQKRLKKNLRVFWCVVFFFHHGRYITKGDGFVCVGKEMATDSSTLCRVLPLTKPPLSLSLSQFLSLSVFL